MSYDLISRSALKTKFEERKNKFLNEWEGKDKIPKQELARVDEICLMISVIDKAPTVGGKAKGEWIRRNVSFGYVDLECSLCHCECECIEADKTPSNFCPNCGAKMEGGAE